MASYEVKYFRLCRWNSKVLVEDESIKISVNKTQFNKRNILPNWSKLKVIIWRRILEEYSRMLPSYCRKLTVTTTKICLVSFQSIIHVCDLEFSALSNIGHAINKISFLKVDCKLVVAKWMWMSKRNCQKYNHL